MACAHSGQMALSFPLLTPETYAVWQVKMKALLQREKLFHTIEDDPPDKDDDDWAEWHAADMKARGTIILSVSDHLLVNLEGQETAQAVWHKLRDMHLRQNAGSSVIFFKKLCRLQLEKGGDLPSHLSQLKRLRQDLVQRDLAISEAVFAMLMINSLDESYDGVAAQISTMPSDRLTEDYVSSVLLNEWDRRQAVKESRDCAVKNMLENVPESSAGESESETAAVKALKLKRCFSCGAQGHLSFQCKKSSKKKGNFRGRGGGGRNPHAPATSKALISRCSSQRGRSFFVVDSGCSNHVAKDKNLFVQLEKQEKEIHQADGTVLTSVAQGTVFLKSLNATIKNVLYAPDIQDNLLSVSQLDRQGFKVVFAKSRCEILRDGKLILYAKCVNGLYQLPFVSGTGTAEATEKKCCNLTVDKNEKLHDQCIHYYHRVYGHLNFQAVAKMPDMVQGMKLKECPYHMKCVSCAESKARQAPKGTESGREAKKPYEVIHADLVGPLALSRGNSRFFMVLIDSYSKYVWVYMLQKKAEAFTKFRQFCKWLRNVHNENVRFLFTDKGGEFCSEEFESFLSEQGIEHRTATPRSPWQNGLCERVNQTLQQGIRTLLHDSGLPNPFWAEALSFFCHVYNRRYQSSVNCTPYEMLHGRKPCVKHFKIFGSEVWVHTSQGDKLSKRGEHGVFLGYEKGSYRVLITDTKTIRLTRSIDDNPQWDRVGVFQCHPICDDGAKGAKKVKREASVVGGDNPDANVVPDDGTDYQSPKASGESDADSDLAASYTLAPHSPKEEEAPEQEDQRVLRRSERTTKGVPPKRFSEEFAKTAVTSNSGGVFKPSMKCAESSSTKRFIYFLT